MHAEKAQSRSLKKVKKRAEFLKIQSEGRRWVSHGLILQVYPCPAPEKRIGFTVSKKVSKSAVVRNRIKRRLRAVAAEVLPHSGAQGQDYVLVGRPQTADRPYTQLCEDLRWCLRKMGVSA